jgi:hypothetical protein
MRYVIGLSFAALAVWVLQATGVLMAFLMFLMIGQVPGTPISLPPTVMMIIVIALALGVAYWFFRQRPVQQIQEMKRAYHEQTGTQDVVTVEPVKKESLFVAGFRESYDRTRISSQRAKYRMIANTRRSIRTSLGKFAVLARPIRMFALAVGTVTLIASQEIANWARPHIRATTKWLRKQANYSLKGTMLSAHKWSSLSKKLLSSLTSLLKRCSSVLKRGKSLLIRSTR